MYYLYLKTHNITGLKYLGKTVQNPHEYRGSGKHWLRHLKKYGNDVSTEILAECETIEDFRIIASEYSDKLNIVESKEFANLVPETGDGGDTSLSENYKKYYIEHKNDPIWVERGKKSRITAKERGTDKIREQKFRDTVNSEEWKNTKGIEKVKKCNAVRNHKLAGEKISQTKQSQEWKDTVGKEANKKRLLSTDWAMLGKKLSETRSNQEWKDTIGKEANKKRNETITSDEWKSTIGKEALKKRNETITSDEWKQNNYIECKYCGKKLDKMNHKKWHGENCKHNKG
jgi:hypothetical protein